MNSEQLELSLRYAKAAYREDDSEENRAVFHAARDALQEFRAASRGSTMGIVADEVKQYGMDSFGTIRPDVY